MNIMLDSNHEKVCELLHQFQLRHLHPISILNGDSEGSVYVDNQDSPEIVVVQGVGGDGELYVAGILTADNARGLDALLRDIIEANKDKDPEYHNLTVYLSPAVDAALFERAVRLDMIRVPRGYLRYDLNDSPQPAVLDEGFCFQVIDDDFISGSRFINMEDATELTDPSQKDAQDIFKRIGYGVAIIHEATNELVSWCGFDYIVGNSIEFGIETAENWQRKGFAAKVVHIALGHVYQHGFKQVGWHYWWHNEASKRTALKAGFQFIGEHSVYHREMNDFDNLTLQAWWNDSLLGNSALAKECYLKALRLIETSDRDYLASAHRGEAHMQPESLNRSLAALCSRMGEVD